MKNMNLVFSLPLQLVAVLLFTFLFGSHLSFTTIQVLYASSLTIKAGLIFILPWIVFGCLFSSIFEISEKKGALLLVVSILFTVCLSNFSSTMIAFSIQKTLISFDWTPPSQVATPSVELTPYWTFSLKPWISNDIALVSGLLLGLIAGIKRKSYFGQMASFLKKGVHLVLNRLFIPLVPFFVLGFSLKLEYEKTLGQLVSQYGPILALLLLVATGYLACLYYIGSGFHLKTTLRMIKNIWPSLLSGFSTMSSAASMPLTLKAAELNTKNPALARMMIPMTANNHLLGDSLFIPLVGLILLGASGKPIPSLIEYLPFAYYFVIAKFAVAAVPGGGIIVMLPILERYLGLPSEMLSLITTLYILFDPFNTAANIAGNGALVILVSKLRNLEKSTMSIQRQPSGNARRVKRSKSLRS